MSARDKAVERSHQVVGSDLADERAAARPRFDDAQELQRSQRFADRGARDLELLREGAFGRELVARSELALFEERLDLLDDALVEPAAPDGLDDGQFGPPRCLVRWSDQNVKRGYDGSRGPSKGLWWLYPAADAGARSQRLASRPTSARSASLGGCGP
jgi:hypothetical protein